MLHSSSDLYVLSHDPANAGFTRQESRDSLIEVALDNTEQIVSKLLGKNSRSILNCNSNQSRGPQQSDATASAVVGQQPQPQSLMDL